MAREGLLAAIDCAEGLGAETPLLKDAMAFFEANVPRGLIDRIYAPECTPDKVAGFARCVLTRVLEGDGAACAILERNMCRLARQAARMIEQAPEANRVGLYGGIFAHSDPARKMFTSALAEICPDTQVGTPSYPPELGALIHLMLENGTLNDEKLNLMKSTYEEYRHE